ncbi:sensor histidine kinase [Phycicoccus sp. CSK15P-2]|uniref:histidine kinase n=1 Tax=Phycicoccus sp. CSK15P-2 TaxID=2807627 RepID=UPI00194DFFB0|nr:histidine kinase [Phycicoccus sp. CSK15P-2]MBM6403412.1 sensor histidine kinase [Phycicoccus sp. CSK15P-2]
MAVSPGEVAGRVGRWFGTDDPWQRPRPEVGRRDVVTAGLVAAFGLDALELVRSAGALEDVTQPWWVQWLAVVTGSVLLVGRRRWPLVVAVAASLHMVVVGVTMPMVMAQATLQVVYFVAIMSGVAWARDRRLMIAVVGMILVVMFTWIALQFAVGSAIQNFLDDEHHAAERYGLLPPVPAAVLLTVLINVVYFGAAVVMGRMQWRGARDRALLVDQAGTIAGQADELRTRAVTEERLRIARELHDVVAHHVSVIGIQAAAARRVMSRDPEAAGRALAGIEGSSREAVSSMRGLLGTLREVEPADALPHDRTPQPGLGQLPVLVEAARTPGRRVGFDLVESVPGAADRVAGPLAHSVHRIVQEALTNVEKHSTAATVSVVVRVEEGSPGFVEVEVVDDGRPRSGAPSSGLGQLGIRERAASHRGVVEIGPRTTGGYRVRVRFPWGSESVVADDASDRPGTGRVRGNALRSAR